uniref:Uncharacterized protein n=1 Tax=Siphoviridae sp. ctGyV19 TaxID=2826225 RepID=A0A8S5MVF9_9CAUD|nr:MAG TPA: hypothetical protein [Siphoviridae sp. ctGyV19]
MTSCKVRAASGLALFVYIKTNKSEVVMHGQSARRTN